MADRILEIEDGFWNIRGSFRIAAGLVDIGTHASLVRLASGRFVLLDAYTLAGEVERRVFELTDGGAAIEAVLHVHPFHTVHARAVHQQLPHARLYGTRRHAQIAPDLPWDDLRTEDPALHARFADDLDFTVPRGVDFVPADERLHFSSVLVHHRATGTLHVDDTLSYLNVPLIGGLRFHPTLKSVLQPRAGAAAEFRAWAAELLARCATVRHLVTAHGATPCKIPAGCDVADMVRDALAAVEGTLKAHERRYG